MKQKLPIIIAIFLLLVSGFLSIENEVDVQQEAHGESSGCCVVCTTGQACGDSCISRSSTCHRPPGCACNASGGSGSGGVSCGGCNGCQDDERELEGGCRPSNGGVEQCGDGIDNDCDGRIDEDCGSCTPTNGGIEACNDGIDNDCDGAIDEGCITGDCTDGATQGCGGTPSSGACLQTCIGGHWGSCVATPPLGGAEDVCGDEIDNDCDNHVDERCECDPGHERVCGASAPLTICVETCDARGRWQLCAPNPPNTGEESCDGLDNDCDGVVDEGCGGGDADADVDADADTDADCHTGEDADIDCEFEGWYRWDLGDGGNCHFYLPVLVPEGISWHDAVEQAEEAGGYLAAITSEAENEFVFELIDDEDYWFRFDNGYSFGPWIGGYQPEDAEEPDGGWTWVTDEPWGYESWAHSQPNNSTDNSDFLHYATPAHPNRAPPWNDLPPDALQIGYVIEAECGP